MLSQRSIGAAGSGGTVSPSDDEFNTVSVLSHFDGDNNGVNNVFDDSSSSNHTITANGDVTQGSFGPFARSDGYWGVAFDGTDDYLTLPANSLDLSNNDFTIESWVFTTSTGKQNIIGATRNSDGVGSYMININRNSNQVRFFCRYNGGTVLDYNVGSGDFPLNAWTHLAVTRDGANLRVFIDGTQVGTTDTTLGSFAIDNASLNGNIYYIGTTTDGASDFQGNLSNLRVVIGTAVYTSDFTPSSSALTAITNTDFLGCQSNRFVDNSTSDHTITVSGNPAVSAFGPFLTSSVYDAGVNGASAYFGAGGDYISSSNSSDFAFGTGDFTVDFWFYQTASSWRLLIDQVYNSLGIAIWMNPNRELGFWPGATEFATTAPVDYNVWNHVALVRSSGVTRIYANGVSGATYSDSNDYTSTAGFKVASDYVPATYGYEGYISNVRAVKGTAVYTADFTPPTAPTTAVTNTKLLLNMADAQAFDSAAQNNLTLFGNAKVSNTQAKFGDTSLYLDGTDDYAVLNDSDAWAFGTGDFTVETWIYLDGTPGTYAYIFDMRNTSQTEYTWALSFNYMGQTTDKLQWATNNTSPNAVLTADYPSLNQWVHIAVCRSGTTTRMFYDGTQSAINTSDSADYRNTGYAGYIGTRHSISNFINAFYDDIRFSKFARYTANFTPPTEAFADKGQ